MFCNQANTAACGDVVAHKITAAATHAESAARARHAKLDAERQDVNGGTAGNSAVADPVHQSGQAAELQMGIGLQQQPGTSSAAGQFAELPERRAALCCLYNAPCCYFIIALHVVGSVTCLVQGMYAVHDPTTVTVVNVRCVCCMLVMQCVRFCVQVK